jgi:hypothetical protein
VDRIERFWVHLAVGVQESEKLTLRGASATVSYRSDQALLYRDDPGSSFPSDLGRSIGRHVIGNDHFHSPGTHLVAAASNVDSIEEPRKDRLFISSRNDQGEAAR